MNGSQVWAEDARLVQRAMHGAKVAKEAYLDELAARARADLGPAWTVRRNRTEIRLSAESVTIIAKFQRGALATLCGVVGRHTVKDLIEAGELPRDWRWCPPSEVGSRVGALALGGACHS